MLWHTWCRMSTIKKIFKSQNKLKWFVWHLHIRCSEGYSYNNCYNKRMRHSKPMKNPPSLKYIFLHLFYQVNIFYINILLFPMSVCVRSLLSANFHHSKGKHPPALSPMTDCFNVKLYPARLLKVKWFMNAFKPFNNVNASVCFTEFLEFMKGVE